MTEVAHKSGSYEVVLTGTSYPRIQIISVPELLAHKQPRMPTPNSPYIKAKPYSGEQLKFG